MRLAYTPTVRMQAPYYRQKIKNNDFYREMLCLRDRFLELDLDTAEAEKWRILNDYLRFAEAGCETTGMAAKCREFLLQFGPRSIFYSIHMTTKQERNRYTQRIFYACRQIQKHKEARWVGLKRSDMKKLTLFRKNAITWVRWLMLRPLTLAQKEKLWEVEHLLGIWWSDLSDEDNGMRLKRKEPENG